MTDLTCEDDGLSFLQEGKSYEGEINAEILEKQFSWAQVKVYVPKPPIDASVSPPMMEAYLTLQKNLYQIVALSKYDEASTLKLSQEDKDKFQINVKVEKGSSDQTVDLTKILSNLGNDLVSKMTPDQIFYITLTVALLFTGYKAFALYLQNRKETRQTEATGKDHQNFLQTINFLSSEETTRLNGILSVLGKAPHGAEIARRAEQTHDALLRAADETNGIKINNTEISQTTARELRTSSRRKPAIYTVEKEMRVISVNTQDELLTVAHLEDATSLDVIKLEFKDAVLSAAKKPALFSALENRATALIKMRVKDFEGDITPLELLDVQPVNNGTQPRPEPSN